MAMRDETTLIAHSCNHWMGFQSTYHTRCDMPTQEWMQIARKFQSTHHTRCDTPNDSNARSTDMFQSTHHTRCDLKTYRQSVTITLFQSTHHTRCDVVSWQNLMLRLSFNPRIIQDATLRIKLDRSTSLGFNPRIIQDATYVVCIHSDGDWVSIHASYKMRLSSQYAQHRTF